LTFNHPALAFAHVFNFVNEIVHVQLMEAPLSEELTLGYGPGMKIPIV